MWEHVIKRRAFCGIKNSLGLKLGARQRRGNIYRIEGRGPAGGACESHNVTLDRHRVGGLPIPERTEEGVPLYTSTVRNHFSRHVLHGESDTTCTS